MKKIYLFVATMVLATSVSAQIAEQKLDQVPMLESMKKAVYEAKLNANLEQTDATAPRYAGDMLPLNASKKAQGDTTVTYEAGYVANNILYRDVADGYINNPGFVYPQIDSLPIISYYGDAGDWVASDTTYATQTNVMILKDGDETMFGNYELPKLTNVADRTVNDTANDRVVTIKWSDYRYAWGFSYQYDSVANSSADNARYSQYTTPYVFVAPYRLNLVNNCALYSTNPATWGNDSYLVGAGKYGKYAYGTNLHTDTLPTAPTVDTIGVIVPNTDNSVMWMDSVLLRIYRAGNILEAVPAGVTLSIKLYPVELKYNEATGGYTNLIRKDTVLAEAIATSSNVVRTYEYSNGTQTGTIYFAFVRKNALGITSAEPAVVTGRFYAELTGFGGTECDFGIESDYYNEFTNGRTYMVVDGQYTNFWRDGGNNINMAFEAIFPYAECDTTATVLQVPAAGGDAMFYDEAGVADEDYGEWLGFSTNIIFEQFLDYEAPDWIEVTFNDYYVQNYNALYMVAKITADANRGAEREGEVVLSFAGKKLTFTVQQAAGGTGVENIKHINDGKMYNILGTEVGKDYKGIVIMNGEKFIR